MCVRLESWGKVVHVCDLLRVGSSILGVKPLGDHVDQCTHPLHAWLWIGLIHGDWGKDSLPMLHYIFYACEYMINEVMNMFD